MSYYKMKCIYCGHSFTNEDVVYKLASEEISERVQNMADSNVPGGAPAGVMPGAGQSSMMGSSRSDREIFVNGEQLKMKSEDGSQIYAIYDEDVKMSNRCYNEEQKVNGKLILGYEVKDLRLNRGIYSGKMMIRRCPHCHKRLPKRSGQIPTYTIGMIGHSTAGKTVFLMMQHYLFSTGRGHMRSYAGNVFTEMDCSHLESQQKDQINELLINFRKSNGILPSTTQNALPIPHCREVFYRRDNCKEKTTSCIISFQDVMGEIFSKEDYDDDDVRKVADFCNRADALIIVTDPFALALPRIVLTKELMRDYKEGTDEMWLMRAAINAMINDRGEINKPCVVMMTKQDELVRNSQHLRISSDQPVVAEGFDDRYNPEFDWYKNFLKTVSDNTKSCIKYLDLVGTPRAGESTGWSQFLEGKFNQAVYIPVSATGSKVTIKKEKYEQQEVTTIRPLGEIHPRFVEVPLIYLLIKFKILPPIADSNFYEYQEKLYDSWYENYAQIKEKEEPLSEVNKKQTKNKKNKFLWFNL